jgi:hypothetical protein
MRDTAKPIIRALLTRELPATGAVTVIADAQPSLISAVRHLRFRLRREPGE